jgi:perosamine synthetase
MSTVLNPIPAMIPVARPYLGEQEEQGVLEVLRSGWVTQGPRVAEFEDRFARYVGCEYAIAVSSCTTALQLSLFALGIKAGDEVICPSLSFIATANSIASVGATPVFGDIDPLTYNLDHGLVESLITPRTRAILVVHQIGQAADMDAFRKIADSHGIKLIEDAACAIGSTYKGRMIGKPFGDCACFSFHPRKIMTTGEGGMITTGDFGLAERIRRLRQHAMSLSDVSRHNAKYAAIETYDEMGFNFRMTDMQAAVGIAQLGRLEELLQKRSHLAQRYAEALNELDWLQSPYVVDGSTHNYQSYMVRLTGNAAGSRDAIMQQLLEKNISTRRGIMAIHRELPYRSERWVGRLPETEFATDACMILPLFHQMSEADQDYVIDALFAVRA